jgi:hypothetical protein
MPRNLQGTSDQRKTQRVGLLSSTDWLSTRHRDQIEAGIATSLTLEQFSELLIYRQALRDWPASGNFNDALPGKPTWLA